MKKNAIINSIKKNNGFNFKNNNSPVAVINQEDELIRKTLDARDIERREERIADKKEARGWKILFTVMIGSGILSVVFMFSPNRIERTNVILDFLYQKLKESGNPVVAEETTPPKITRMGIGNSIKDTLGIGPITAHVEGTPEHTLNYLIEEAKETLSGKRDNATTIVTDNGSFYTVTKTGTEIKVMKFTPELIDTQAIEY